MLKLNVIIIGAGLGGLCLAQALRKAEISADIFERDDGPWERPQGYRLHIDADGAGALASALSSDLFELFDMTAMEPEPYTTIVDTAFDLRRRIPIDAPEPPLDPRPPIRHANVNRATLREILLRGLDVHFGARLVSYRSDDNGVIAHFADGRIVRGDLLVGADGVHSAVRRQRCPNAAIQDTGVRAIYGRIPIGAATMILPGHVLQNVFTVASDARKVFLGLGPVVFPVRPDAIPQRMAQLRPQDDYVSCIIGGPRDCINQDDAALRALDSAGLQAQATEWLSVWPDITRRLPAHGDPASFFLVEMATSVPTRLSPAPNVTLLGDAIHAMTPTLGRGANLAMRDARRLAHQLIKVVRGELSLTEAVAAYEADMTAYGFDVVRKSAAAGVALMGQRPLPE